MIDLSPLWDIARACGKPKRAGKFVYFVCPCHEDREPSCSAWYGAEQILVRCFAGCDWHDVKDKLRSMGFVLSQREHDAHRRRDLRRRQAARPPAPDDGERHRLQLARRLWAESAAAPGTAVEQYLLRRGLALPAAGDWSIRYHSWCPRGRARLPAMLCALRDVLYDDVVAVHRTFLTDDCRRDGKRMVLGATRETAIKLGDHKAGGKLFVCEGVETGIGAMLLGYAPVWALGSAGAIANFEPLFSVGALVVLADNDAPGLVAARSCAARWRDAGWPATIVAPRLDGADFADVAARQAVAA